MFVVVIAASSLAIGGSGALLAFEVLRKPIYDQNDPDYSRYSEIFARLEEQLARREMSSQETIDLSPLNGGDWRTACVFGGYNDPLKEMRNLGAVVSDIDQHRLSEAGSRGFRLSQVEEFEMMIAYVDRYNHAHFIHFERGIGALGQHLRACISKPDTKLVLGTEVIG